MGEIGVIFDCDGTLLDSMGVWHSLDDRLAQRVGATFTQEDRDYMTAATIAECAGYLHEKFGVGTCAQDVQRMIDDDMYAYYTCEASPKPGALEFVRNLYELGIPMGVASSTPTKLLHAGLEATGFSAYMRTIVSVDDLATSKREPVVFDAVRDALGTKRAATWGFEDAVYAIHTLHNAGYHTCGIFDSDIAGTSSQLQAAADCFIMSFADITADGFIALAEKVENG